MSNHARQIDPGPRIPTIEIANANGATIIVNAAPEYDGEEDDRPAKRAHAKALAAHAKAMAEWSKMGYAPVEVVDPTADQAGVAKKPRK